MEENKKVETEEITTEEITENSDLDITEEISEEPKNNKKSIILIAITILVVLSIAGYFFLSQPKEKVYDITYPEVLDIEYGSDLSELITVSNADKLEIKVLNLENIEVKDIELNKDYKLEITVVDSDKETVIYKEGVKFVDTTAPVIEVKTKEVEIPVNHVVIKAEATATDNYDKTVKVDIDTKEVDVTKVGTYKVYAIAKDTAGNESKVEIPVKVVEENSLSETAKETIKKQIAQYIKENPDSEVAKQYNTETTTENKTTTSNTNNNKQTGNATVPSTGKSQQQIAAEEKAKQQEAQRRAEEQRQAELNAKKAECEAQWGKWNGSACTWDQPAEQPSQPEQPAQPSQPTDNGNTGGRDDGCSVSAKLAEYEAYAGEYASNHPDAQNWMHTYDQGSGQLRMYIKDSNGIIGETVREYYCKQP